MQRSVRQTERRIPAAAVAVEERQGRAGSRAALQAVGVQDCTCTYRRYRFPSHGRWRRKTSLTLFRGVQPPRSGHGMERSGRVWRLRHMRDAWLLLRTIGRPGGCREHGTRASIWFSLPSSPVRLGGQRLARVAAGRPPLKTHVACGAGMSLGGNSKGKEGQMGHVFVGVNGTGDMQRRCSLSLESRSRYLQYRREMQCTM